MTTMRIKEGDLIPRRWFVCGIFEHGDGSEYYFAVLRLPSYQYKRDFYSGFYQWHQLGIIFHGKHGFRTAWFPLGPDAH